MPELPDLEIIRDFLQKNVRNIPIQEAEVLEPLVLRCSARDLIRDLEGKAFTESDPGLELGQRGASTVDGTAWRPRWAGSTDRLRFWGPPAT